MRKSLGAWNGNGIDGLSGIEQKRTLRNPDVRSGGSTRNRAHADAERH